MKEKTQAIADVLRHIGEKADCELVAVDNYGKDATVKLCYEGLPPNSDYLLSFFEADGAGTLGIKIRWTLGRVSSVSEVWKCLVLNEREYLHKGTLFAAIIPNDDEGLFSLVGQMLFPPGTPAEEVATLWFNQAFLNYILGGASAIPGVEMF